MTSEKKPQGRARQYPVHESWSDYVAHFDLTDPTRSQGAFCRWSGIRASSLSSAKRKPIPLHLEELLSVWIEELQKAEPNEG